MKKFLAAVSLMLVALMVIAIPAVSAADETIDKPEGINIHYATDVSENAPLVDGTINVDEYGPAIRIDAPMALKNSDWGGSWETGEYDETLASEYMDVYFAYDDEYIYFAFYEMGADPVNTEDDEVPEGSEIVANLDNNVPFRNNYRINIGFELDNVGNYIQADAGNTVAWNTLSYFVSGTRINQDTVTFDWMVEELIVAKRNVATDTIVGFGDLFTNGNGNYKDGQWSLTVEFKFSKEGIAAVWNELYATEYKDISNAMWIGLTTNAFRCIEPNYKEPFDGQYFKWIGQNDITGKGADYADYGARATSVSIFDLVVFGDEDDDLILADPYPPAETEPATTEAPTTEAPRDTEPVTEAPTTEPATEAPATEAPVTEAPATEAPETEAPTTEAPKTEAPTTEAPAEEEGGCGSSISVAGLALVAALGTCTVFVAKKRD